MKRLAACLVFWIVLFALPLRAEVPTGNFTCAISDSASGALDAAKSGKRPVALTVAADSFGLSGGELNVMGRIAGGSETDSDVTGEAGPAFQNAPAHTFTTLKGEQLAKAAFSQDGNGAAIAILRLTDGQYFLLCADKAAIDLNFDTASQAPAEQPKEEPTLTDEQKLEKQFAEAPQQRGKEVELFGRVNLARPDEGHYDCKATSYLSGGEARTNDMIDSDDDHTGFDLFADGSVRLKRTDGKFEDAGDNWRHNPANGVVLFPEGTLSVYLKWPVHVRKKLSETMPEVSMLYMTDYDYDGPIDDMTICIFTGPPQSKSPKAAIAELAQKNLNPPPPGTPVKVAGLYYRQQWVTQMGFGQPPQMYQEDYYYYRYFQTNGYVWLNGPPDDGDFEKLGCNKPMVDEKGEPTCTTYSVEDGLLSKPTIRIGHDAPIPLEENDATVSLDGESYFLVAPQDNLRIEKFVKYFSYNGIAMREGSYQFKNDGTYESSSGSGVMFTTEIPDVSRTSVTGYNPGKDLKGQYQINGHTMTLTTENGNQAKIFFGRLGEGFFMIGGQPYFEPSD